ncbi:50S ribosomal protein L29 [Microgenomates group bacterium RBG_16_45_19]|nr:MAG: 50S ribosomal protein L29 [Microgenomates group bacterium RBG_16_45_19]
MKQKDKTKYQQSPLPELLKAKQQLQRQLIETKISLEAGKLKNVHQVRTLRANLARILTIIRAKTLVVSKG